MRFRGVRFLCCYAAHCSNLLRLTILFWTKVFLPMPFQPLFVTWVSLLIALSPSLTTLLISPAPAIVQVYLYPYWCRGMFSALQPEGSGFESTSSRRVGTLGT